jgi:hypothetical protein
MQNAKDTFYELLRGRIATINPYRTIVLRGVTRPAVLVVENELVSAVDLPDCFRISWTETRSGTRGAMPTLAMQCEIAYETAGTALNAGMDRGRTLGAMDAELLAAIGLAPQTAPKQDYAGLAFNGTVVPMSTGIWWSGLVFGEAKANDDRVARTATLTVMSFEEAGEL